MAPNSVTTPYIAALDRIPDLTAIGAAHPRHYPYYLDSAATGPLGRFSLLLRATGETLVLDTEGGLEGPGNGAYFLDRLDDWCHAVTRDDDGDGPGGDSDDLPFLGGWFLYLGYELAAEVEPILALPPADDGLPTALAARCDGAVILRHGDDGGAWLVAETAETLAAMRREIGATTAEPPEDIPPLERLDADPGADFEAAVKQIHEYLLAGDVFQVNLSRGWRGRFAADVDPAQLYRRLRRVNPAPFAGMMRWGRRVLMSASPERLVEVRGQSVQTRPIAGTHPRDRDPDEDRRLWQHMLAHPKERAEHIMLIDLERNDLGRVCEPGSVEVNELMVVESYAHVHHIVSNVRGRLRSGRSPVDVVRAVFPGGTITGCPKVRCMQIIAELEGRGRGFYTGAMGYIDRRGHMDLNILIRSLLSDGRGLSFRTGAGIVADSDPAREVAETGHKAQGLLSALGAEAALP